jgi:hypothetical protein
VTRARLASTAAVAVIAALAVTAAAWFAIGTDEPDEPADERPVVEFDKLVLAAPPSGVEGDPVTWTIERTWSYPDVGVPNLVRRWSANGRAPELTQIVYRHRSSADAERSRRADSPADRIAKEFAGSPTAADSRLRLSASHATISCAAADRAGCKIWVYWARYGQYDVGLDYTSVDAPVPLARFEAHVQALDHHLTRAFQ